MIFDGPTMSITLESGDENLSVRELWSREKWKPVVGFEGRYEVSDMGRVRSLIKKDSRGQKRSPGILAKTKEKRGEGRVTREFVTLMAKKAVRKQCSVHKLVVEAFLGKAPEGKEICHNNGNPIDNRLSNLRYDTHKNNEKDKLTHGTSLRGERNPKAKLTKRQAVAIKNAKVEKHGDLTALAKKYNVSLVTVSHIKTGRQWAWL